MTYIFYVVKKRDLMVGDKEPHGGEMLQTKEYEENSFLWVV